VGEFFLGGEKRETQTTKGGVEKKGLDKKTPSPHEGEGGVKIQSSEITASSCARYKFFYVYQREADTWGKGKEGQHSWSITGI